ncbi:MAG TPA: PH domain-containing protein [Actinobacteria bacterium]|nr:PH domain-containing protein [Actinomycetota bacterium]
MAYPERLLSPGERVLTEFRPHWKLLIAPVALLLLSIVVAIAFASVTEISGIVGVAVPVGVVLLGLGFGAKSWVDWFFTKYIITNERLVIREGLIARRGKEIPLERIDNVSFSQTVGERILRSGDLIVESAGEGGQSRYTDIPQPEETQSMIYRIREARILALEGAGNRSSADEISKLADLRDQGVITEEEFEKKKRRLLDDI